MTLETHRLFTALDYLTLNEFLQRRLSKPGQGPDSGDFNLAFSN
jgi:hypothetical protein